MQSLETAFIQSSEYFYKGNGQQIRELLMRQAVRSCENYSTDILVFFESEKLKELIKSKNGEITIWFRNMGVDWDKEPSHYRYVMLLRKTGPDLELFGGIGNS